MGLHDNVWPPGWDYEEPDPTGPGMRCTNPKCRDEWYASTIEEWQGTPEQGAMLTHLDDLGECPSCKSPGLVKRGEEDGFLFGDEDIEGTEREALYAALDGLEDLIASMTRLQATTERGLDATTKTWIRQALDRAEQRHEYAIEKSKES